MPWCEECPARLALGELLCEIGLQSRSAEQPAVWFGAFMLGALFELYFLKDLKRDSELHAVAMSAATH